MTGDLVKFPWPKKANSHLSQKNGLKPHSESLKNDKTLWNDLFGQFLGQTQWNWKEVSSLLDRDFDRNFFQNAFVLNTIKILTGNCQFDLSQKLSLVRNEEPTKNTKKPWKHKVFKAFYGSPCWTWTNDLRINSYRKKFSTNFFASIISNFPCNNGLIQSNGLISIPLFLQRPKSFTPVFQSASPVFLDLWTNDLIKNDRRHSSIVSM